MGLNYIWLIPSIIAWCVVYSWLSKLNNELRTTTTFIWMIIVGMCPLWAIASRISKNLIFDGMLYDIVMFATYVITMEIGRAHV